MDNRYWQALVNGLTCDITTIGRVSGQPRRIEIWYFVVDGRVYLTGTPGPRDWLKNLRANPQLTFHIKEGAQADLPAHGLVIDAPAERQRVMGAVMAQNSWFTAQQYDLAAWVAGSPLVEVVFD
jgi:deazaflavin-dependent oxidoreductase (nitroreductase family)